MSSSGPEPRNAGSAGRKAPDPASPTLELARALIERPSVTPEDAGCQELVAERLAAVGFEIEWLPFGGAGDAGRLGPHPVTNLWARRGTEGPLFCFLGHTDVVPPGPESAWTHPPFQPTVDGGVLYGRGSADMKGSVAAFVTAAERIAARDAGHPGSMAVLLTSDEEGPAQDGVRRVAPTLQARGESVDYCLVGEPSSDQRLGDVLRVGRRGSLTGTLTVQGVQGHVAYPDLARNPIHQLAPALDELVRRKWDAGDEVFPPTHLQISNLQAGTGADNVIPGTASVVFNFRFGPEQTPDGLKALVHECLDRYGLDYELEWRLSGEPFVTRGGTLIAAAEEAVRELNGCAPIHSTGGGTSDGRFLAPLGAEVVELGPLNRTIHQANECIAVDELEALSTLYERIALDVLARATG